MMFQHIWTTSSMLQQIGDFQIDIQLMVKNISKLLFITSLLLSSIKSRAMQVLTITGYYKDSLLFSLPFVSFSVCFFSKEYARQNGCFLRPQRYSFFGLQASLILSASQMTPCTIWSLSLRCTFSC